MITVASDDLETVSMDTWTRFDLGQVFPQVKWVGQGIWTRGHKIIATPSLDMSKNPGGIWTWTSCLKIERKRPR